MVNKFPILQNKNGCIWEHPKGSWLTHGNISATKTHISNKNRVTKKGREKKKRTIERLWCLQRLVSAFLSRCAFRKLWLIWLEIGLAPRRAEGQEKHKDGNQLSIVSETSFFVLVLGSAINRGRDGCDGLVTLSLKFGNVKEIGLIFFSESTCKAFQH